MGFENMTPIMFVTAPIGDDHGKDGEHQGYGNIAGQIGPGREQAQQIINPDKEKRG